MAETAYQIQYRQQVIAGFEQKQSLLRNFVTTEAVIKGNTATFLVADSGSATAVTRGVNGKIPSRADNLSQLSATLQEWHDKPVKTGFNVFASQGDGKRIMQETSMGVINRKIDSDILSGLSSATVGSGDTAVPASIAWLMKAATRLQNADVPWDGGITYVGSPASIAYLLQTKEFTNAEYISSKPLDNGGGMWMDKPGFYRWNNINFISHPNVTGVGTSSSTCYLFHRSAIGHAANVGEIMTEVGYNGEDDYSYSRVSIFMGAKLLQNSGVIVLPHDDSGLSS